MSMQLWLGLAGLVPTTTAALFAFRQQRRRAKVALVFGIALWSVWAIFHDASGGGWNSGMTLVP